MTFRGKQVSSSNPTVEGPPSDLRTPNHNRSSGMQWPSALHEFYSQPIPSAILFSAAMSACETCGQWLQAMHLFQALHGADNMLELINKIQLISSLSVSR